MHKIKYINLQNNYQKSLNILHNYLFDFFFNTDIAFVGSGGKGLNSYLSHHSKTIVVSLFPGIVVEEQIEAFISRLKCDLVLVNSKKDAERLKKICAIFKVPYNGLLLGANWYSKIEELDVKIVEKKYIVFFEQIDVPKSKKNRMDLITQLIKLTKDNPDRNFFIKSREEYIFNELSLLSLSKNFLFPKNLKFTDMDTNILIHHMDVGISISSSTAIEAVLANKYFILLEDYGYNNTYLDFFKKSNLILKFKNIDFKNLPVVNNEWKEENITNPYEKIDNLKKTLNSLKKRKIFIKINFIIWIKLFISYPKKFLRHPKLTYKRINNAIKLITKDQYEL